ncbi:GWxTD domain-containing protein [Fodinibius salinus]|uniref:GWxTD domain-containing protein n=1 Tax=Fodinibius salinus TaxID=860790 RepID=A0A5D3YLX3_9BACT|nr:GWxTD domain-containing protein [Fodinibius salinus]TYP95155.1 GWxTD domain-containing protein [Fodinibius salinus]
MNLSKLLYSAIFVVLLLPFNGTDLFAQRLPEYVQLARSNKQEPASFDQIILPGDTDSTVTLATVFNMPYSYLSFKKNNSGPSGKEFYSAIQLNMEVFKSNKSKLGKRKDVSVEGLPSVGRTMWSDTAFAADYQQSQSTDKFVSGYVKTSLTPGVYSYVLQMKQGQETESRRSRAKTLSISRYNTIEVGNVILGENFIEGQELSQLVLSRFGKNVKYATDFYALVYLPDFNTESNYSLTVTNLNIQDKDTSKAKSVYSKKLAKKHINKGIKPSLVATNNERVRVDLQQVSDGYTYALIKIPGTKLPNAVYRLTVDTQSSTKPVAQTVFQTVWPDIPNSLLSLDVAVDMLRFIADDKTINRLSSGTKKEREQKFRDYWKKRDPSPKTEFNELMTEYYNRIDYAFEKYSSKQKLGYNTDQGKVYIKYGPPNDIERKFPTKGATTEIWSYPSREFIFKATSGFGDFRLVEQTRK